MTDDKIKQLGRGYIDPSTIPEVSPYQCLAAAIKENLLHVAIVGRKRDGELIVWTSDNDIDRGIALMHHGLGRLSNTMIDNYDLGDDKDPGRHS